MPSVKRAPVHPDTWQQAYHAAQRTGNAGIARACARRLPATADVLDVEQMPKKLLPGQRLQARRPAAERAANRQTEPLTAGHDTALWIGAGMLAMLLLWAIGSAIVAGWQSLQDDMHYGRPRTFQTDARVGHDDTSAPSHFIATNNGGRILVIEFAGGDARKTKVYDGGQLSSGQELTPVTLEFRDVTGDGKPDMIIIAGAIRSVLVNDGQAFRTPKNGEVKSNG